MQISPQSWSRATGWRPEPVSFSSSSFLKNKSPVEREPQNSEKGCSCCSRGSDPTPEEPGDPPFFFPQKNCLTQTDQGV